MKGVKRIAVGLDRWHWALLALAAPCLLFPSPVRALALLALPAIWIAAWLAGQAPLPRTPLNGALLLLSVMVLVSLYATYSLTVSLPKLTGVILGIGVFYAYVRVGSNSRGWWMSLLVFLAAGAGVAGLGLLGTRWLHKLAFLAPIISRLPPRLTGLPGAEEGLHPNEVAGALLWVIPAYIALAVLAIVRFKDMQAAWGRRRAIMASGFALIATLFVIGVLALTQSRGGYIALAASGIAMMILALLYYKRKRLVGVLVLALVMGGIILARCDTSAILGNDPSADPALSLDTMEFRLAVWSSALQGIQDFPFTGMGMNTFRHIVHVFYPLPMISPSYDFGHAHNEFLQAALDLGLPGLAAFIALYIGAFWMLAKTWRAALPLSTFHLLLPGLAGGLFAHLIYGLTDAVALGAKPGVLFWMLLGLITALYEQARQSVV